MQNLSGHAEWMMNDEIPSSLFSEKILKTLKLLLEKFFHNSYDKSITCTGTKRNENGSQHKRRRKIHAIYWNRSGHFGGKTAFNGQ